MTDGHTIQPPPAERGIFCNRTLNLRSIRAIGYDMDYTLVHYKVAVWEERAYAYVRDKLAESGWPVEGLTFDEDFVIRGLVLDTELGNIVKANRFGYIKQACHGMRRLSFDEMRSTYARQLVDLSDRRWAFLNTFFSLSEACIYAQLVDRLDEGRIDIVMGYRDLYDRIRQSLDATHAEGRLKQEIIADPARYIELDEQIPLTLLDQKASGKRLLLITNSEWPYTRAMMSYCFDELLPGDMTWRDLFEIGICSARKPHFFSEHMPLFEVIDEEGLLQPVVTGPRPGGVYVGGHVALVEDYLELSGSQILYVGDHIYTDVRVTKDVLRWRTALMVRELEQELVDVMAFRGQQAQLNDLMDRKERIEFEYSQRRLQLQRADGAYGPDDAEARRQVEGALGALRDELVRLDESIAPLARSAGRLFNPNWGLLMRTGRDKSHLARQVERYADVYTSRVSNFLYQTPFVFLRSPRGSMPHDPTVGPGWDPNDA